MPNQFSKEERVAFDQMLAGFQDALVLSRAVSVYRTDMTTMERANDVIWRPQPYIMQSYDGMDQTGNFKDQLQLSVPASIGFQKVVPWQMNGNELRDALQEGNLGRAAYQKVSSDINVAVNNVAALQGTLVVKRTVGATGFDDIALIEAVMNEQGVNMNDRIAAVGTRDYNGMASNLAARSTMTGKPENTYAGALIGRIASFDLLKLDYSVRLAAAAGTGVVVNGANQYYVPKATSTATTGEVSNVDNRFQNLTVTVGGGAIKIGDAFTIAGVNAVHHITKQDTGQPKTFRVTNIISGAGGSGVIQISPPLISAQGASGGELQYKNVTATPANGAAITFLNTVAAAANPFWVKDAIEILPARIAFPPDAGWDLLRGSTDQGFELTLLKQGNIDTGNVKYRVDARFGVVNKQPEMTGIELFNQT